MTERLRLVWLLLMTACVSFRSNRQAPDPTPGLCAQGAARCTLGGQRQVCDASGLSFENSDCPASTPVCFGAGRCGACTPGTGACDQNTPLLCNADGAIERGDICEVACHQGSCRTATGLALGESHTCVLFDDGHVRCVGDNAHGQLGSGSASAEVAVDLSEVVGLPAVSALAAGRAHTCALASDGSVWCFGANNCGQLGTGDTQDRIAPTRVSGVSDARAIASSPADTTYIVRQNQVLQSGARAEGSDNQAGCLNGARTSFESIGEAERVTATEDGVVTISPNGSVAAAGNDALGQLGDGALAQSSGTFRPAQFSAPSSEVVAGKKHVCAVVSGQLECTGDNTHGQTTGALSPVSTHTPAAVAGMSNVTKVALGGAHTCALTAPTNELVCFGRHFEGQTGIDPLSSGTTAPTAVGGSGGASVVAAGARHTCFINTSGNVLCFGDNSRGQLGNGEQGGNRFTPMPMRFAR